MTTENITKNKNAESTEANCNDFGKTAYHVDGLKLQLLPHGKAILLRCDVPPYTRVEWGKKKLRKVRFLPPFRWHYNMAHHHNSTTLRVFCVGTLDTKLHELLFLSESLRSNLNRFSSSKVLLTIAQFTQQQQHPLLYLIPKLVTCYVLIWI